MTQLAEQHPRTRSEWAAYYAKVRRRIDKPRKVVFALPPPVPALAAPQLPAPQLPAPQPAPAHAGQPSQAAPDFVPTRKRWCPTEAQVLDNYTPASGRKACNTLQHGLMEAVPRPAPEPPTAPSQVQGQGEAVWAAPMVSYRCHYNRYVHDHVMHVVCQRYNVTRERILGPQRTAEIVRPRQLAMYLIHVLTDNSLPSIGRMFGGKDHTTILCAVRRVEQLRARVPDLEALVLEVLASFGC